MEECPIHSRTNAVAVRRSTQMSEGEHALLNNEKTLIFVLRKRCAPTLSVSHHFIGQIATC